MPALGSMWHITAQPLGSVVQAQRVAPDSGETFDKERCGESPAADLIRDVPLCLRDAHRCEFFGQFPIADGPAFQLSLKETLNPFFPFNILGHGSTFRRATSINTPLTRHGLRITAVLPTGRSPIAPLALPLVTARAANGAATGGGVSDMEIRTATTLRRKATEIHRAIVLYEKQLERARADLAHVEATLAIFEARGDPKKFAVHVDVYRVFGRGELITLCKAALASGPKTTKELALYIMRAKGMNVADVVLAKAVASRMINALGLQRRGGAWGALRQNVAITDVTALVF